MLKLLGAQEENYPAIVISLDYSIYDGNGNLRQTTTNRDFALQIVAANKHMGAYCRDWNNKDIK